MNDLYMSLRLAAFGSNINMINNTQYRLCNSMYEVVKKASRQACSLYGARSTGRCLNLQRNMPETRMVFGIANTMADVNANFPSNLRIECSSGA